MKLFRTMVLAAGVFALASFDGTAQEPMPTTVEGTLASHTHRHADGVVVAGCAACAEAAPAKVCVKECVPKTKVVYEVKCREYCVGKCSFFGMLRSACGDCADGACGEVRTKKVLIKKIVPDGTEAKCVLKDAPTAAPHATGGTSAAPVATTAPVPAGTPSPMPAGK